MGSGGPPFLSLLVAADTVDLKAAAQLKAPHCIAIAMILLEVRGPAARATAPPRCWGRARACVRLCPAPPLSR
eukprot:8259036-Alexandrium_andersonii.AAC.1